MQGKFVGRQPEFELLNRLWGTDQKAQLMILYGRRRVGKTRLLSEWKSKDGKTHADLGRRPGLERCTLKTVLANGLWFRTPRPAGPGGLHLRFLGAGPAGSRRSGQRQPVAVFIDEFTYLLASDPTLAGKLQILWDQRLGNSNLLLCLSDSHLGRMQRRALAYQAPLYGRATAKLNLLPLGFGQTRNYFPNDTAAERVALYAIFGGIPQYWGLIQQDQSITANIKNLLLSLRQPNGRGGR